MSYSIEESLLEAVKKDDIKAFNALMEKARCASFRLGRFPVLSLMYLYKSRRLIAAHEENFIKTASWEELREPAEISKKFAEKAGKCLRLYLDGIVSPLEMLLILNKTRRLKRVYPLTKPSEAVKGRLKSIYSVRYALNVKFAGNKIIIDRRPLSYGEKKKIATAVLSTVLAVTVAVGVPVTTVSLMPKLEDGEVTKLSHIDFSSKKVYTLKKDVTLPENFSVEKVNCTITGSGKKLIFGKGATLGEFNGKLTDITIESCGEPIFTTISESAEIKNITVNVSASVTTDKSSALVAMTNYGTIDGVTVNVSGNLSVLAGDSDGSTVLSFGGFVQNNSRKALSFSETVYGTLQNCTVNYSGFTLTGEAGANAEFGGISGINTGRIYDCTVTGKITADTFDVAGICADNRLRLSGNINEAEIIQTSADKWHPVVCGIAVCNSNIIEYCENRGNVSAVTTVGDENISVTAAGIVQENAGTVRCCVNSGALSAAGSGTAFVGGICTESYAPVYYCLSEGEITVRAKTVYAGGIVGFNEIATTVYNTPVYDFVQYCISKSKIDVTATDDSYVGGVVGFVRQGSYVDSDIYFGGGVVYCFYTGKCVSEVNYSGNIVGGVGANIYETNSYTSGGQEYHIFEGNYYTDNSRTAFGAAVAEDGPYAVDDDRGSATCATPEEIENSEDYQKILSYLLNF